MDISAATTLAAGIVALVAPALVQGHDRTSASGIYKILYDK